MSSQSNQQILQELIALRPVYRAEIVEAWAEYNAAVDRMVAAEMEAEKHDPDTQAGKVSNLAYINAKADVAAKDDNIEAKKAQLAVLEDAITDMEEEIANAA